MCHKYFQFTLPPEKICFLSQGVVQLRLYISTYPLGLKGVVVDLSEVEEGISHDRDT